MSNAKWMVHGHLVLEHVAFIPSVVYAASRKLEAVLVRCAALETPTLCAANCAQCNNPQ